MFEFIVRHVHECDMPFPTIIRKKKKKKAILQPGSASSAERIWAQTSNNNLRVQPGHVAIAIGISWPVNVEHTCIMHTGGAGRIR